MPAVLSAILHPVIRWLDKHALPKYDGSFSIPGLKDTVKVFWQSHGVPHVLAANEPDLFLAQGYLHAQERLWQMDMSRRFLSGRMAEVFGDFPLPWNELASPFRGRRSADFDFFIRLTGIRPAAAAAVDLLSDDGRQRLEAYSKGVNRYIENCGKRLPWEFRLLRYHPDPWHPEDSLTIGKGLAFLLSTAFYTRLNMIAIAVKLDGHAEKLRALCPFYPEDGPTTARATWDSARGLWHFTSGVFAASDWNPAGHGSNNWVIGPTRSVTGNAIFCNDPHLRLTLPAIWYLMHLKTEPVPPPPQGYDVWGATIPGLPYIHCGHNRWIAWGMTAALCDDVDLYREKIHRLEPDRYLAGHEWRRIEDRQETIGIRGRGSVTRVVRSTRHGPVISDFTHAKGAGEVLSFRWTAHEPGQDFDSLYGVNRARDWNEFLQSLSHHAAPTLNYAYADRQGNIGYALAGKIPIRAEIPSLLPVEGWTEKNEWLGYIPFTELPRLYNPPDGVIATANNRVVDSSYPYYLSHLFEPHYRIRRIRQLLAGKQTFSLNDMRAMQSDVVSLHATDLIAALSSDLLQLPDQLVQLKSAAKRLLGWDGTCAEDSVEAAIFHVFHHRLLRNLLVPELGEELFSAYVEIFNQCIAPTDRILKDPGSSWFDSGPRSELVARSLEEACEELQRATGGDMDFWQWGKIHTLKLHHALGRVKILQPLLAIGPWPSPGNGLTLNLGFYRHSRPYAQTVGASLRYIIDLARGEHSGFVLPSGQSGHPFSPYFRDQTELWRKAENIQIDLPETHTQWEHYLVLEPTGTPAP